MNVKKNFVLLVSIFTFLGNGVCDRMSLGEAVSTLTIVGSLSTVLYGIGKSANKSIELGLILGMIGDPDYPEYLTLDGEQRLLINTLVHASLNKLPWPGGGVLLYGAPGNGKTAMVNYIAAEGKLKLLTITPATLSSGSAFSTSTTIIKSIFQSARLYAATQAPLLIFIDEFDFSAGRRDTAKDAPTMAAIAQLLLEIEKIADSIGIYVITATNYPENIDIAFLRDQRLGLKFEFKNPSAEARKNIIKNILSIGEVSLSDKQLNKLTDLTEGLSCAGLAESIKTGCTIMALTYNPEAQFNSSRSLTTKLLEYFGFIKPEKAVNGYFKFLLKTIPKDPRTYPKLVACIERGIEKAQESQRVCDQIRAIQLGQSAVISLGKLKSSNAE